jgi:hypothetical protein
MAASIALSLQFPTFGGRTADRFERIRSLERTQVVPRSLEETFDFFADPGRLEAITPSWLRFRIVEAPLELRRGSHLR